MSFVTLKLAAPGVKLLQTATLVQSNIHKSQAIRWRGGLPEKLGGWQPYFPNSLPGPIREMWGWADLDSVNHVAIAGDQGQITLTGNAQQTTGPLFQIRNPSLIGSTAGSNQFLVTDSGSNATTYEAITLQAPVIVGGIIIQPGNYPIVTVVDGDHYYIQGPDDAITTDANGYFCAFSTVSGSSTVTASEPNNTLAVGDNFSIIPQTLVGGLYLQGFYTVATILPPPTALAVGAFTSGSTFTINTLPSQVIPGGALITDTTTGQIVGTVSVVVTGTTVTINQANPIHPVGNGDTLSFASGNFTFESALLATTTVPPPGIAYGNSSWVARLYIVIKAGGPATGTPVSAIDWCMENFGSKLVINPQDQPIFTWDPTSGLANAQIIVNAPPIVHGTFVAMPQQMVVAYGCSVQGVQDPMLVAWCDAGNLNVWAASTTNQAGTYRLTRGSKIVGAIQGPLVCMLWTDVGLWLMQYIGYPDVWGFLEVSRGCGLIAKKAVATVGTNVYWMGKDGFWMYAGGGAVRLQCDVWDVIKDNINVNFLFNIRSGANTPFDEVEWYFPSLASTGENDTYVKFNVVTGEWDYGMLPVSDWLETSICGNAMSAQPDPGIAGNSFVFEHEKSPDANGLPLAYSLQTGYFTLSEAEQFVFIDYCIPDFKWQRFSQPPTTSAQIELSFFIQDYPDDPTKPPIVLGPYSVTNQSDAIDIRARGRYLSLQIAGNDLGSFMRLGGIKFRIAPDGRNPN